MRLIDADKVLQEFPIRKDHCDDEHGNEHFVYGIETVMEYIDTLADDSPINVKKLDLSKNSAVVISVKPETLNRGQVAQILDKVKGMFPKKKVLLKTDDTSLEEYAPVIRAKWEKIEKSNTSPYPLYTDEYKCSNCGRKISICTAFDFGSLKDYPYCNCGAKMER